MAQIGDQIDLSFLEEERLISFLSLAPGRQTECFAKN